jgi:hypothetical protein
MRKVGQRIPSNPLLSNFSGVVSKRSPSSGENHQNSNGFS